MDTTPFEDLRARLKAAGDGKTPYGVFKRHTPEQRAELEKVRDEFQRGEYGGLNVTEVVRIVREMCLATGIPICGEQGVRDWLYRRD